MLPGLTLPASLAGLPGALRPCCIRLADITCLWYGCLDTRTVQVILARDRAGLLALLTCTLITARISKGSAAHPTPEQTKDVLAAWHAATA